MQGRLKLRETDGAPGELISYRRADRDGPKVSSYHVVRVLDPEALAAALEDTLGVRAIIEKARRLILWRGTRIHLDAVAGLGTFVELEAMAEVAGGLVTQQGRIEELRAALGIGDDALVARSYADLIGPSTAVHASRRMP